MRSLKRHPSRKISLLILIFILVLTASLLSACFNRNATADMLTGTWKMHERSEGVGEKHPEVELYFTEDGNLYVNTLIESLGKKIDVIYIYNYEISGGTLKPTFIGASSLGKATKLEPEILFWLNKSSADDAMTAEFAFNNATYLLYKDSDKPPYSYTEKGKTEVKEKLGLIKQDVIDCANEYSAALGVDAIESGDIQYVDIEIRKGLFYSEYYCNGAYVGDIKYGVVFMIGGHEVCITPSEQAKEASSDQYVVATEIYPYTKADPVPCVKNRKFALLCPPGLDLPEGWLDAFKELY